MGAEGLVSGTSGIGASLAGCGEGQARHSCEWSQSSGLRFFGFGRRGLARCQVQRSSRQGESATRSRMIGLGLENRGRSGVDDGK